MTLQILDPRFVGGGIAVAVFLGILLFLQVGRWIGRRTIRRHGEHAQTNISSLEAAVFALLGLLIAFTFSGALSRFDERRAQVVDEGNAIGTAWLRIDLLPAQAQPKLRDAFRAYVDSRIATYRLLPDIAAAKEELARSQRLQGEIWAQSVAALRLAEVRPATEVLLVPALNQMFDITSTRIAATQMHPPGIVYGMLVALALAAALLSGYQSASEKTYDWVHKIGFAAIVSLTVYVILDIEFPRLGLVRIDAIDQILVGVRAGMQ
ncbi:MAG TPA: DUF4239 domain-containing protein [Burkholderiales bacterium]|nr:DUF4239 domain-containing protein [Burkholderiales bacterium]